MMHDKNLLPHTAQQHKIEQVQLLTTFLFIL